MKTLYIYFFNIALFLLAFPTTSIAQIECDNGKFNLQQAAMEDPILDDSYIMTQGTGSTEVGSFNSEYYIDLEHDFVLEADLYFGKNNESTPGNMGGDYLSFVLQNLSNALVDNTSLSHPHIIIDFDTHQQSGSNDPEEDHIAIFINAGTIHGSASELTDAVELGNIEDDQDHAVIFEWDSDSQVLTISFDEEEVMSLEGDIVFEHLGDVSTVYWGFWARSLSSASNEHAVRNICMDATMVPVYTLVGATCDDPLTTIDFSTLHGVADAMISYSGPQSGTIDQGNVSLTENLTAGEYKFVVTDTEANASTFTVVVPEPVDANGNPCDGSAVYSENENTFVVYPNPSSGLFYIDGQFENSQLEVFSITGKKCLYEGRQNGLNYQLDLSEEIPGIYLVKVNTGNSSDLIRLVLR